MLRLVYLVFIYRWYDGSLLDFWPFKILATLRRRYRERQEELSSITSTSEGVQTPEQDFSAPSSPVSQGEPYPPGPSPGVASVRDVEHATPAPSLVIQGGSDDRAPASYMLLSGSSPGGVDGGRYGSTATAGREAKNVRKDNDLKRSVIANKLTPLVVLSSFVSDLDIVADWVFFNEGLGGQGQLIYFTALVFAVVGTIMYVLVTVEFHLISKARTWWAGKPLSPLQHVSLGWQLGINVIVEDIPQLVITCVTSPTSVAGVLNITTAAFSLLAKMAEAFATRRDLPLSSQLRMIEANPGVVRHVLEQQRNAEELAANAAKISVLVNKFGKEAESSKRQVAIAFHVMQADPGFLDGELDYIREMLQAPTVELNNSQLEGFIPPALGDLTQLTELNLGMNQLNGPIPLELGSLGALRTLNLGRNRVTGTIPSTLGDLAQLTELNLWGNQLRGPIPSTLGNLLQLLKLNLGWNRRLRGPVPPALFGLTALQVLDLSCNQLSGPLPSALSRLTALRELRLVNNRFTGPIPSALTRLVALRELRLAGNKLAGSIPPELGEMTALTKLDLFHAQLTGWIPPALSKLTGLKELRLGCNELDGSVPSALGGMAALEKLDVRENNLTGPIPDLRQTALHTAAFYDNNFDGNKVDAQRLLPRTCIVFWESEDG